METNLKQVLEYTWKNVNISLDSMRTMFDLVRLVDAEECRELEVLDDGTLQFGRACYAVWDANHRCANCTSLQACHTRRRKNRMECYNGKRYQIQSIPVRITLADETVYSCNIELINFVDMSDAELNEAEMPKDERENYMVSDPQSACSVMQSRSTTRC